MDTKRRLTLPYALAALMPVLLFLLTLGVHDHFHQTTWVLWPCTRLLVGLRFSWWMPNWLFLKLGGFFCLGLISHLMHRAALRKYLLWRTRLLTVIFLASPRARKARAGLLKLEVHGRRQSCLWAQWVSELRMRLFPTSRASAAGAQD